MQSALAPGAPPALETLLQGADISLFLDFDGTLVEIATTPASIAPLPDLSERLSRLSARLNGRLAIVSGRAISDIEKHTGSLGIAMAGSHGSDIRTSDGNTLGEGPAKLPKTIENALRNFAAEHGIDYEDKPHSGALHYRRRPDLADSARSFASELASQHGWAVQSGKCVVELVAGKADKGGAVQTLMVSQPFEGSRPIFVGDDLTDEAGFMACRKLGGLGILVGERAETQASHALPDVNSVHQWLEL